MSRLSVFLVLVFVVIVSSASVSALPAILSDQGTGVKLNGGNVTSANLTITIWTNETGYAAALAVFNRTYAGAIVNGSWNVLLNDSVLDLEFGKKYWKDYAINGTDLDFSTGERLPFYSSVGAVGNSSQRSVAIGEGVGTSFQGVAIGTSANATSNFGVAIGNSARADVQSVALGVAAVADNTSAIAIGNSASASAAQSTALGFASSAAGYQSTALGVSSYAANSSCIAIGYNAFALGNNSITIGRWSNATGAGSSAIGMFAQASYPYSIALGTNATTTADNQFMVGSASYPLNTIINGNLTVDDTTISDVLKLTPKSSAPAGAVEGLIYFNNVTHKPCYYNSTDWVAFDGGSC
jgi:hypothetical protein